MTLDCLHRVGLHCRGSGDDDDDGHWRANAYEVYSSGYSESLYKFVVYTLFPIFGRHTPPEWNTFAVLEFCNMFHSLIPFSD